MPELSRFFGIRIEIFHDDHAPPHFPARYGDVRASFTFDGDCLANDGDFSAKAHRLMREWAALHLPELEENWRLATQHEKLKPIDPLP